jgi:cell division protein FtsI/penicillin-binding protein 2
VIPAPVVSGRKSARVRLAILVTVCLFAVVVARLAGIQLLRHEYFARRAEEQHTTRVVLEPARGRIFDRNGFLLAGNRAVVSLEVYWPAVPAGETAGIDSLVASLGDYALTGCPVDRSGVNQCLARDIPYTEAFERLRDIPPWVHVTVGSRRVYPMEDYASCIIGRYSPDVSEGIENQLDGYLSGRSGVRFLERSAFRGLNIVDPEADNVPSVDGVDVVLTIDSRFQFIVQDELARAVEEGHGTWGAAVLVDPSNGDILAMASYPTRLESGALAPNHCIASYHEPGSTFKVIPLAAALEESLVERTETWDCSREAAQSRGISIGDCHHFEVLTLDQVIAYSSNVGTVLFSSVLPDSTFYGYCADFGFGSRTSIELPGELDGVLHPPSAWSAISKANLAIGQEVTVTPLQLAMAYCAIANGGIMYEPRLVAASRENGVWREWSTFPRNRVISEQTSRAVREILTMAVREGTGTPAAVAGVAVAGKTGTAERLSYGENAYLSAFAGIVPADRPELVLVVVVDQPDYDHRFGSTLAAPSFSRMMARILSTEPAIALSPVAECGDVLAAGGP